MPGKKSAKIHALNGNPSKLPNLGVRDDAPPVEVPEVPDELSPQAKAIFGHLCAELAIAGTLTLRDRDGLAMAATDAAVALYAISKVRDMDTLIEIDRSHQDRTRRSVWYSLYRDSSTAYSRWVKQYGLTPLSRIGLTVEKMADEGEDEKAIFG